MTDPTIKDLVFYTLVRTRAGLEFSRRMIASLRRLGGALRLAPMWVFEVNPQETRCAEQDDEFTTALPLELPDDVAHYMYADKVYAGAKAESIAGDAVGSLVWIAQDVLVVNQPGLYDLGGEVSAALRPVHIQNVGLKPDQPLDVFWRTVYKACGMQDTDRTIQTLREDITLRAYYNTHAFSIDPSLGLLGEWFQIFRQLVLDEDFQQQACADELHQIFLHQAPLSALVSGRIPPERTRILPVGYNYPYEFQASLPEKNRVARMNDLATLASEGKPLHPDQLEGMEVDGELREWLFENANFGEKQIF